MSYWWERGKFQAGWYTDGVVRACRCSKGSEGEGRGVIPSSPGFGERSVFVFVWMSGLIVCILCLLWSECKVEMLLLIDTKVWCCAVSNRAVRDPIKPHFPDLRARSFVLTATNCT